MFVFPSGKMKNESPQNNIADVLPSREPAHLFIIIPLSSKRDHNNTLSLTHIAEFALQAPVCLYTHVSWLLALIAG